VDDDCKLQGRLLKNSEHHEAHVVSATTADRLTKRISQLTIFDPTRISQMTDSDSNLDSASGLESHSSSLYDGPSPFPFGLSTRLHLIKHYSIRVLYMMVRVLSRLDSATRLHLIKHYFKIQIVRVLYMMIRVLSRLDFATRLHLIKHYFKIQLV
jgi:hypothetical protein